MSARRRLLLFFAVNYFVQGMVGIVYEPISYLLKDSLGLNAGQASTFVAWMTAPFLFKPLLGLLSDFFPLGLRPRRPQMILSAALGAAGWLILALGPAKTSYWFLLLLLMTVNGALVFSDVVCDGMMVEAARRRGSSALFQAVQIGTLYLTLVVTGLGGGWLAAHAGPRLVFGLACGVCLLSLLSTVWVVEEQPAAGPRGGGLAALRALILSRLFWKISAIILLWNFTPLLGTAQFYFQSERLGFGPVFIGLLTTLGGLAGALGAFFFGRAAGKGFSLERLLSAGVWLGGPLQLLYLFYGGAHSALLITLLLAFLGVIFRLALMDMAALSCPKGGEATAFAAYMSMFNLAAWASNTAGGKLYAALASPDSAAGLLCCVGAATTLASWPLVAGIQKNINFTPA